MSNIFAEYVWIDGTKPTPQLRSKVKVLAIVDGYDYKTYPVDISCVPVWGFDGSSTNQAGGSSSDCILNPVRTIIDPDKDGNGIIVLCEVLDAEGDPHHTNERHGLAGLVEQLQAKHCWFGIEQEYTLFSGESPLGWPSTPGRQAQVVTHTDAVITPPEPQGPYYCAVGSSKSAGREIVDEHLRQCIIAGIPMAGTNAEVMLGQWEFQIGPRDALAASDYLWLARYLLFRICEPYNIEVCLDPKPVSGDWNGSGAHTNFSTERMRASDGLEACIAACERLKARFMRDGFPTAYGDGFERRLTGKHETCSYEQFKYGVADRTASVRIPLHVSVNGCGYIEDRRPCSNMDPYRATAYLIETICG